MISRTQTMVTTLLSDRLARLREERLARVDRIIDPLLRLYHYTAGWMESSHPSLPVRGAEGLARVIENLPVCLHDDDYLVGEHGDLPPFLYGPPANYRECIEASSLAQAQREQLIGWLNMDPFGWKRHTWVDRKPPEQQLAEEHRAIEVWGVDTDHSVRDYAKVLRLGFSGIRAEVEHALATLPITAPDAPTRRANLLGWRRLCQAAETLGHRHAEEARARAASCEDTARHAEWKFIADVCEQVPAKPARTFREALQALWFAHMITCWEDGVNANSIGRIDQILWPYLERDLDAGVITREEATDLLSAYWIKMYQVYDVQQMMIGGVTSTGEDATNPLSYLVLDVTERLGFVRCLSARLHQNSPREFVARCVDLVAHGGGIPFFFNDDVLIPALTSHGIALEDARDYAAIGCIEITIPGKASPHPVSHWINLAKCLELALNDGCDLLDGTQVGPQTGLLTDFQSMDEVLNAYSKQLEYFASLAVYGSNAIELAHRTQIRLPYHSLLTDDCISRGTDIIEGGAKYNYHSSAAMAIPNVADSLAALDQAVFTDKTIEAEQLLQAMREDFANDETLRQYLLHRLPKYGNDQPLPDTYAANVARQYCELLGQFATPSGGTYFCHLFTYTLMLPHGKGTGALPDGRHAGEPLAYSLSPAQGRDITGLTAVMQSLAAIPHELAAASSSAIIEVDPALLEGVGRQAFVDLLCTAIQQRVGQLQFNVVNADTLRAAQTDPERYRSLCVRVSGFSQQFRLLEREMQDHIIARTKHRIG